MSKINNLLKLIKENPELPIVPMVDYEVVCSDDHHWWMGGWGESSIDEWLAIDENIYFKSQSKDRLIQDLIDKQSLADESTRASENELEEIVDNYNWVKCIVVRITLPD